MSVLWGVQSQPALGLWAWKSEPDKGRTPASLLPGCQLDAPLIGMENRREEQQKPIRLIAAVCRNNGHREGRDSALELTDRIPVFSEHHHQSVQTRYSPAPHLSGSAVIGL
ncbi:hypothetical protein FQA47_015959 [Oryzias melastigma]|uniref:Uncharacterized protein n=1 Tax=Oryzias melastigma TaxID=30732 RepID=A0A834C076_ORYME|nr:hypothetical protein FQA47_015959 [Oryzias melastigma]